MNFIKKIAKPFVILLVCYLFFLGYAFFEQDKLIFFPSKNTYSFPSFLNLTGISIINSDNTKLNAWFLDNKTEKIVIFCHGNAGNLFSFQNRLKLFNDLKISAILFDYRGYGKSEGKIENETDLYVDAESVYNYLLTKGYSSKNIIIWGYSLGGAVAVNLAQNKNSYLVILESSFYSMKDLAREQYWFLPIDLLLRFNFRSDEKIGNIHSPILIIHSLDDEIIKISYGKKLFDKANFPKTFLEINGSHNDGFKVSYDKYFSVLNPLLK